MDLDGVDLGAALVRLYGALPEGVVIQKLRGDASTRSYYRLTVPGRTPDSLVAMRLPVDALGSDEGTSAARPPELPFVAVQRLLVQRGIPVPQIHLDDTAGRVLLLEDLGDETFHERLTRTPKSGWPALYGEAVDLLARMHEACARSDGSLPYGRSFDRALLRWELDHFREWGLEAPHGVLGDDDRAALDAAFDALTDELLAIPTGFVHRDYQSRNLMWRAEPPHGLVVIDFQDALLGPRCYDLVALLCDSYVDLDLALQRALIARYCAARGIPDAERPDFERSCWQVAVQRKLKDSGRFVFIDRVRSNPDFLRSYPQSLRYAGRALRQIEMQSLTELLAAKVPGFPDAAEPPAAATGSAANRP
jgi:aminoglycoside/choline kinase family phosphotransferase